MPQPALVLFDDSRADDWQPLTLTRPAGELLFGALTPRARAERALGLPCIGHLAADTLSTFDEPDAPPVLEPAELPRDRDLVYLCSRTVLEPHQAPELGGGPALLACGDRICGCVVPAGADPPPPDFLRAPGRDTVGAELPAQPLAGRMLRRVWTLATGSAEQIARDVAAFAPEPSAAELPDGVHRRGDGALVIGRDVELEPGVVLDLSDGPIWLDDGARVRAFSRIAGPAYVGPDSTLLGGTFTGVAIGPVCKVHGELEESVVLGYANKAHDGYIGHAYLGRWVNLGAMTTNSDLKNNYGSIRLWTPDGVVDTGETKLGCLLGDHVKTAIGTLLNTGTVAGAGANVFGSAPPPTYIPPFAWGTDDPSAAYDREKFLETAETVMARRDVELTARQRELLRAAWRRGRGRE